MRGAAERELRRRHRCAKLSRTSYTRVQTVSGKLRGSHGGIEYGDAPDPRLQRGDKSNENADLVPKMDRWQRIAISH